MKEGFYVILMKSFLERGVGMADEHFWDHGVSQVSTDKSYFVAYENLSGEKKTTHLMTIDEALAFFNGLKSGRETVEAVVYKYDGQNSTSFQQFKANVIDVGGTKMII